jgi:BMFP domain-containing protein YqiC
MGFHDELQAQLQDRVQEFARMRDELIVQANLAQLEAREEWAELEARLAQLKAKADEAGDIAEDTAEAMAESAKEVLDELQRGYEKLRGLF